MQVNGRLILRWWQWLQSKPGGKWLFSRLLGLSVPYSGSIGAKITTLQPGYAQIVLPDRRRTRNHLRSTHAIALANVGELASGLALLSGLEPNIRGIVVEIRSTYLKKARGTLVATCHCEPPPIVADTTFEVCATIRDSQQDIVAEVRASWRLGVST